MIFRVACLRVICWRPETFSSRNSQRRFEDLGLQFPGPVVLPVPFVAHGTSLGTYEHPDVSQNGKAKGNGLDRSKRI